MKVEMCYANEIYATAQKWNVKMAYKFGKFDKVYAFSPKDLPDEFKKEMSRFLKYKRGDGYWVWKSYLVDKVLAELEYGDYLFYCDSGSMFIKSVDKLISVMESNGEDIMLFEVYNRKEREWTKRDIFTYYEYDVPECTDANQIMSTYILLKKTEHTVSFIKEWMKACHKDMLITDEPNEYGKDNYPEFVENRHDQSLLSVLAKKERIKPYRDPSQWGGYQKYPYKKHCMAQTKDYEVYERSKYPTMFLHHRLKGDFKVTAFLSYFRGILGMHRRLRKNPSMRI